MSMETLENLVEKAGSLSPAERLLLASRLSKVCASAIYRIPSRKVSVKH